jgi:hypothetical protein
MAEVFVVDRVVTAPGCAQKFVDAYLEGYVPGARQRGMTLRDVLVSPPIWFDDRTNVVTATWSLPSPEAWWQMTWQARPDPAVAGWWQSVTDLVVGHSRDMATAAGDVEDSAGAPPLRTTVPTGVTTTSVTRLIDVKDSDRDRMLIALRRAADQSGALRALVQPTLPGSRNGGDILVHLRFRDHQTWEACDFDIALTDPAVTRVNGATYRGAPSRRETGGVYRTLLLRVPPEIDPETVVAFENELAAMPRYVPTITAWQLSRADQTLGPTQWTHVFEQEFTSVDGLMGPYLMHPIHWASVDRWFDPETSDVVIRDRVCHSFCTLTTPMLV